MPETNNSLPLIGAQFFANPNESDDCVEKHFSLMKETGITLVRVFLLWADVEPAPSVWDFQKYDRIYNLAARYGLRVVTTLTCEDPPAFRSGKDFYHHHMNLNDPALQKAAGEYIRRAVTRYKDHPAHFAWSLMNEPEVAEDYSQSTMALFAAWLKEKYGTVEEWHRHWYRKYSAFEDVTITPQSWDYFWMDFKAYIDWQLFLQDNLCYQLSFIRGEVKKYDQNSPTHAHPKGLLDSSMKTGQQIWKEAGVVDTLGVTIHPAWDPRFTGQNFGKAYACCIDLIRSGAGEKPFWVTELQGGPVLASANKAHTPSPAQLTAYLWDALGAGAKAVIYWMWHPRNHSQEAGDWGIATLNHRTTPRLLASNRVSGVLREHAGFFENARREKAKVAIFYNHGTEILSAIQKAPAARTPSQPIDALRGVYYALSERQIAVDFLCAEQITQGALNGYEMLYLPFSYAMDRDVQRSVAAFVERGGRLWADAPCAWKQTNGEMYEQSPDLLSTVFGAAVTEYCSDENALLASPDGAVGAHLCMADFELCGAKTAAVYQNTWLQGAPAVTRNSYGMGEAVLIGTAASLGYAETENPAYADLITRDALAFQSRTAWLLKENRSLLQRVLLNGNQAVCVLENWGKACDIALGCDSRFTNARELMTGAAFILRENRLTLSLEAGQTACLLLT